MGGKKFGRTAALCNAAVAQRARTGEILHAEQVVPGMEGSGCTAFVFRGEGLAPLHQRLAPKIGRRIVEDTEVAQLGIGIHKRSKGAERSARRFPE